MKRLHFLKATASPCLSAIVLTSAGCKKTGTESGDQPVDGPASAQNPHQVNDPRLVGE